MPPLLKQEQSHREIVPRGRTFSRRCHRRPRKDETKEEVSRRGRQVLEDNFLLRDSRRVLSVSKRRHTLASSKIEPTSLKESTTGNHPNKNHQGRYTLPSRKKNSLQPDVVLHETWYYSSNHVLVNRERMMRGIPPLMRSIALDEMARNIATLCEQTGQCQGIPSFYNGNVIRGESIRSIHEQTMKLACAERENLLNTDYREFGMATHKSTRDGSLYLCQLFDRTRIEI
jgi:hypothetical protein